MLKTRLARPLAAAALSLALLVPAHAHHDGTAHAETAEPVSGEAAAVAQLGELSVAGPWSRATPPMANVAAGYLTIRNEGSTPERLLSAASPAATRVEIHLMTMENDVMSMREVEGGLEIAAGGEVLLAPGGYHLMLVGLAAPLAEGDRVPVTLTFEGGSLEVELDVQGMGARSGPAGHGGH